MIVPLQIVTLLPFQPQILISIGVILVLLIISALVSGAEPAFFSLTSTNVSAIKESSSRRNSAIIKLLGNQDYLLATILIVNNLTDISITILSNSLINQTMSFGSTAWEFTFKIIIVTSTLLLFGEITPKIFGAYNPLRFSRMVALPMLAMQYVIKPFSYILIRSGNVFSEKLARKKAQISIDELSDAMTITENHTDEERKILSGIVSFVNTEVAEIMVLRIDIETIDITADFEQVKRTIIESGFSRIPVYEDNIDNIKGILYVKDMTPFISQAVDFEWQAHLRTPYFVPERKKINDLLEEFQANKVHLAVVVDEYGATQGLVSLEDILEEIVGEISDESDPEQQKLFKKIAPNTYIFEGKTHLSDFESLLELDEDYFSDMSADVETLAGLMLELNKDFLQVGDSVATQGVTLTVMSLDGRRIEKVKVNIDTKA